MTRYRLHFDIQSYWHPGTGRGAGTALDAITHRDSARLPVLPGRTVKGLIRDAVVEAAELGWLSDASGASAETADRADRDRLVFQLFGWRPRKAGEPRGEQPAAGALRFGDAALPEVEASHLRNHPDLLPGLYRSHFSTAIDHDSQTALAQSLRGMEVIVPLKLTAPVEPVTSVTGEPPPPNWPEIIHRALPLLRAVGAHRHRGLGRAVVTLEPHPGGQP